MLKCGTAYLRNSCRWHPTWTNTPRMPECSLSFVVQRAYSVRTHPSVCALAVSAGSGHSFALTADGAAWSWGRGERGCLGHGEDLSNQLLPKKIEAWAPGQ